MTDGGRAFFRVFIGSLGSASSSISSSMAGETCKRCLRVACSRRDRDCYYTRGSNHRPMNVVVQ
jgi:hypothetical protein